jgi:muramoyltetrapeptide carboxypeptidase
MKPFQVDRALMHLRQAGKLAQVRGIIFGEFPECEAPAGSEDVRSVVQRITEDLKAPVVWGAAVGHTPRPMLTLPLGVRARLEVRNEAPATDLFILEPAVV